MSPTGLVSSRRPYRDLEAIRSLGIELQPQLETGSTEALKQAVLTEGFTIISSLAIEDERPANPLRAVRIKGAGLRRALYAVKCRDRRLRHAAPQFWSWLETARRSQLNRR